MTNKSIRYLAFIMLAVGVLLVVAALKDLSKSRSYYAQGEIVAVPTSSGQSWPTSRDVRVTSSYEVEIP